jgi:hypothetical protein
VYRLEKKWSSNTLLMQQHVAYEAACGPLRLRVEQQNDHVTIAVYDEVNNHKIWDGIANSMEEAKDDAWLAAQVYLQEVGFRVEPEN